MTVVDVYRHNSTSFRAFTDGNHNLMGDYNHSPKIVKHYSRVYEHIMLIYTATLFVLSDPNDPSDIVIKFLTPHCRP